MGPQTPRGTELWHSGGPLTLGSLGWALSGLTRGPLPVPNKPGQCPRVRMRQTPEPCSEEDSCTHDRDCPRQEKCCFSGCDPSPGCPPPTEHPGECPRAEEGGTCLDLCSFDEECPWGHKCCSNGCGHVCMPASLQGQTLAPGCESPGRAQWGQSPRGPPGTDPMGAS
uniref:WAP domain-containing protein n=1 Tax=Calidris pygmaea TaxID=425635 RepID=A0A8C3JAL5_9CHAR